ncbi:HlyD family secretion protein [Dongshaea marina]|uniref:HlyD family secretion protein n=1 Tax=Dongshaea marina TaxID=2047966 RepID=UPI000D3E7A63|nr:HlyD family secretion protein [Dongshaea marina]
MKKKVFIAVIALVVVGCLAFYWRYSSLHPSTDNAYIKAHVDQISSQVSGQVSSVEVSDHQEVTKGQLLFTLDSRPFEIAVTKAKAELDLTRQNIQSMQAQILSDKAMVRERESQLQLAQKNNDRILALVAAGQSPVSAKDDAQTRLAVAQSSLKVARQALDKTQVELGNPGDMNAQLRQAKAVLAQAELDLQHTRVLAPADGTIEKLSLRAGDAITEMQPQFVVIESKNWWVDANFKETDLSKIRVGQSVDVELDLYPGLKLHGKVADISDGSGSSFSILPPENATGNWVKVTQRFPVKIKFTQSLPVSKPLRMGASANVTVNASKA